MSILVYVQCAQINCRVKKDTLIIIPIIVTNGDAPQSKFLFVLKEIMSLCRGDAKELSLIALSAFHNYLKQFSKITILTARTRKAYNFPPFNSTISDLRLLHPSLCEIIKVFFYSTLRSACWGEWLNVSFNRCIYNI